MHNLINKMWQSNIIKAGSVNTIANFAIRGIGYLSVPIFIRMMTMYDYGMYNTFLSYIAILSCIIGLGQTGLQQTAKYDMQGEHNHFLLTSFILSLLITLIILCASIVLLWYDIIELPFSLLEYCGIAICSFFSAVITTYSSKLSVYYEYKQNVFISFFTSVINVAFGIFFIAFRIMPSSFHSRALSMIINYGFVAIIVIIYVFWQSRREVKAFQYKKYVHYVFKLGSPLILHLLANSVLAQFDRIMILEYNGAEKSAIYSFIYTFGVLVLTLWTSVEPTWAAWEMKSLLEKNYISIRKISFLLFGGLIVVTEGIILLAPELVKIIGQEGYWEGTDMVVPLVLSVVFIMLTNFYTQIEYYERKMKYLAVGTAGAAIMNIVLNYFMIPFYGYKAAAYTTLVSYFLMFVFHYYIAHRLMILKTIYFEVGFLVLFVFCIASGFLSILFVDCLFMRLLILLIILGCEVCFINKIVDFRSML